MFFEQIFVEGLAHSSYIIGDQGVCAVIDPKRDVDTYLEIAEDKGFKITHIIETHLHADFVSGHLDLAAKTGAKVCVSKKAGVGYEHVPLVEADEIELGTLRLKTIETPGHTPEHICLTLADTTRSLEPWMIFTGDTLFVGDVGRPDLFGEENAGELAAQLFDSLHNKLLRLHDSVEIYPGHGEGSLCGRSIGAKRHSTIGFERRFNYALQANSKGEFLERVLKDMPEAPGYFKEVAHINKVGPKVLGELPGKKGISPREAEELLKKDHLLIDVRPSTVFGKSHIEGAFNVGLSPQLSSWAGRVIPFGKPLLILLDKEDQLPQVTRQLVRVGLDDVVGYLEGGIEAWQKTDLPCSRLSQISVHQLKEMLERETELQVLDVRTEREWNDGHISNALHIPGNQISDHHSQLDKRRSIAIICGSGYRSSVAGSILQRHGFSLLYNVNGGMGAWKSAHYPETTAG